MAPAGTIGAQPAGDPETNAAGRRGTGAAALSGAAQETAPAAVITAAAPGDRAASAQPGAALATAAVPSDPDRPGVAAERLLAAVEPRPDDAALSRAGAAAQAPGAEPVFTVNNPAGDRHILRQVAGQMAVAVQNTAAGQVTLQLAPVELGRVDITLQARDQGMSLLIAADRPETLDLMRRHVDQLAGDLRALGFGSLDLQFQQNGQPGQHGGRAAAPAGHMAMPDAVSPQPDATAARVLLPGRLDLRF